MFGTNARRAIAGAGIALMVTVGAGACGGGGDSVDKASLIKAVKGDHDLMTGELKGAPAKVISCIVDAAIKYGDKDKLKDYVDGKGDFEDTVSKDNKDKANEKAKSCS